MEFNAAFIAADFPDTARVQKCTYVHSQASQDEEDDSLDTYISTFRHLAKEGKL